MALHRLPITVTSRTLGFLVSAQRDGELELAPPYQRGSVWTETQRRELIRSLLRGVPVPAIFLNVRDEMAPWTVVDGKQRIEAILAFVSDQLPIPAEWVDDEIAEPASADDEAVFSQLSGRFSRQFRNSFVLPVCESRLRTEAEERELYDVLNFGGTPHSESQRATPVATRG